MEIIKKFAIGCCRQAWHCMRFFRRRLILGLVNLLAGPPTFAPLQLLRVGLLGILGMKVGCRAQISEQFYVLNGDRVSIGDEGRIGSFCLDRRQSASQPKPHDHRGNAPYKRPVASKGPDFHRERRVDRHQRDDRRPSAHRQQMLHRGGGACDIGYSR
jgi:hypothetical protein